MLDPDSFAKSYTMLRMLITVFKRLSLSVVGQSEEDTILPQEKREAQRLADEARASKRRALRDEKKVRVFSVFFVKHPLETGSGLMQHP